LLVAAQMQAGDIEAAKERLERLLTVLPQDLDTIIKLSECLRRRGDTTKAVEQLRKGVEYHPGSTIARSQLGQILFVAGDMKGALAEFREAYRLAPDDPKSLNNLAAAINYADGDLSEALALAEQAHSREPHNPQILDTLAWVLSRRGQHDRALPLSEMAVALQSDLPIISYHHGAILAALGRQDAAKESLKQALRAGVEFHGSAAARALLVQLSGGAPATP
jgi:Flp pilus assembly protein TadD